MKNTDDILKIVTGQLNSETKKTLLSKLDGDPSGKEEFRKIKNAWALLSSTKKMPDYQVENLYLDFRKQLAAKQKVHRLGSSVLLRYVAVFIFAIGLSALFFYSQSQFFNSKEHGLRYTSVFADNGQISRTVLPDGSIVWLNSGTKITYNTDFAIDNREINLSGQAFFQVTKNKKLPLKVFCNNLEIKVLGTTFDVSAYPEDHNISVVLESGKVELLNTKIKSFHYELAPGEMALYDEVSKQLTTDEVSTNVFTSWKEGILIFRDDPMSEVIAKLKRKYDIDIEVKQPDVYKSVFTATIKNETLEEIFNSISFACSVKYQIIKGKNINTRTKVVLTKTN